MTVRIGVGRARAMAALLAAGPLVLGAALPANAEPDEPLSIDRLPTLDEATISKQSRTSAMAARTAASSAPGARSAPRIRAVSTSMEASGGRGGDVSPEDAISPPGRAPA